MQSNKKNKIIITMIVMIFFLTIVYATFSASLSISGTGSIASNWDIHFSNIETTTISGKASNLTLPEASGLRAVVNADFKMPGDYITYRLTLTNAGTLNAIVNNINAIKAGSDAIIFTIEGLKKGDIINKGQSKTFTLKVEFDSNVTSMPKETNSVLTVDVNLVQYGNQSITSETSGLAAFTVFAPPSLISLTASAITFWLSKSYSSFISKNA